MDHMSIKFKIFNIGVLETSFCVLGYSREGISKLHRKKGPKKSAWANNYFYYFLFNLRFRLFGCLSSPSQ
jgi:hypothetical protein